MSDKHSSQSFFIARPLAVSFAGARSISAPIRLLTRTSSVALVLSSRVMPSAYLADGMTRDDRTKATLDVRVNSLIGADMDLAPAKDTARGRAIKKDCEECLSDMMPPHQVGKLLRNGL